jgi:hypothetical protein
VSGNVLEELICVLYSARVRVGVGVYHWWNVKWFDDLSQENRNSGSKTVSAVLVLSLPEYLKLAAPLLAPNVRL